MLRWLGPLIVWLVWIATYPLRPLLWLLEWADGVPQLRQQMQEVAQRPPLSDQAIADRYALSPEEAHYWSVIRRATAHICALPETVIYPDDKLDTLFAFMRLDTWLVLDWSDVIYAVEDELGVHIGEDRWQQLDELDVKVWTTSNLRFHHFAAGLTEVLAQARQRQAS
jgi:hypothetical protein